LAHTFQPRGGISRKNLYVGCVLTEHNSWCRKSTWTLLFVLDLSPVNKPELNPNKLFCYLGMDCAIAGRMISPNRGTNPKCKDECPSRPNQVLKSFSVRLMGENLDRFCGLVIQKHCESTNRFDAQVSERGRFAGRYPMTRAFRLKVRYTWLCKIHFPTVQF
jgi:hypothetical protein